MRRNAGWLATAAVILAASAAAQGSLPLKSARDPLNRFTISVPAPWSVQTSTAGRARLLQAQAV